MPLPLRRMATVEAYTKLVCLTLKRDTFTEILGPLEQLMAREKSNQVVAQKMAKLQPRGSHVHRPQAEVLIKRKKKGRNGDSWEVVRARGHLDEVLELRKGGSKLGEHPCLGCGHGRQQGAGACGMPAGPWHGARCPCQCPARTCTRDAHMREGRPCPCPSGPWIQVPGRTPRRTHWPTWPFTMMIHPLSHL